MKPKQPLPPLNDEQMHKLLFRRLGQLNDRWPDDREEIDFGVVFENVMEHGPDVALRNHIEGIASTALLDKDDGYDEDDRQADAQTKDEFGRRWIWRITHTGDTAKLLIEAVSKKRWRLALMLAGVMSLGDTIRAAQGGFAAKKPSEKTKAAKAAPAKAVRKTAKKKPAAKKPAPVKKAAPATVGKIATLKDLVAQAKPLFEKNPKLDRQGLINKIGRRYERLTTFDELRTLCAGKSVTTHSVKKDKPASTGAQAWPFATQGNTEKKPRARRDPTRPVVLPESSIPKGVRTKPWPQPIPGTKLYREDVADHAAEFKAGEVTARFTALETESGWTHGCRIDVDDKRSYSQQLREDGPLAQDPNTAIRDCTAGALKELNHWLKDSEPPTEAAKELAQHVADMLKLRSWLLGFQVKGVDKIAFLKKSGGQLELAA